MTNKAGSVFIMDVTNSSGLPPDDVRSYLQTTVYRIKHIADMSNINVAVQQRLGDELLLVAEGYATAYLIAFWLMVTWKYSNHRPYFGVGFGNLVSEFPQSSELHEWNSPVVKLARVANEQLKGQRPHNREWLKFGAYKQFEGNHSVFSMLNEFAEIQDRFFKLQTSVDRVVSYLSLIENQQDSIADRLEKSPSTISRQLKKSNIDLIVKLKDRTSDMLILIDIYSEMYLKTGGYFNLFFKHEEVAATLYDDPSGTRLINKRIIEFYRSITSDVLSDFTKSD